MTTEGLILAQVCCIVAIVIQRTIIRQLAARCNEMKREYDRLQNDLIDVLKETEK